MLSGRLDKENIAEFEGLISAECKDRRIILDLKEMTLTGQEGIAFLAHCEAAAITLADCDPYVREWITRAVSRKTDCKQSRGWDMASAAKTEIIEGNSANIAFTFGQTLDSQPHWHSIPIVFSYNGRHF